MSGASKSEQENGPVDVEASEKGYYGGMLRNTGDKFRIAHLHEFSHRWMKTADPRVLAIGMGAKSNG